jgi:aminopeptidase YwaD
MPLSRPARTESRKPRTERRVSQLTTVCALLLGSLIALAPQSYPQHASPYADRGTSGNVCAPCVRSHMDYLASDTLRGRGSGTQDEHRAAEYAAAEFKRYGLEPAGAPGSHIEQVTVLRRKLEAPPRLMVQGTGGAGAPDKMLYTHGREMLVLHLGSANFSGPLQKVDLDHDENAVITRGAVVLVVSKDAARSRRATFKLISQGAAAILLPESSQIRRRWEVLGSKLPELPVEIEGAPSSASEEYNVLALSHLAAAALTALPDGTMIRFEGKEGPPTKSYTWNAVARIAGSDPSQQNEVVLLTAHLDHLGVGSPVNGDTIYNGADDDASGVTAVLELARYLALQPKPRRPVIFALFGSEESGGLGSAYFREHPPVPLKSIAAYLEFEMIGRPDPAVPDDTLWLTGWERSNLGPELASHGAHLVGDPHPDQGFFQRSDNYVFARKGVVAQTVSSYGLHADYHQPSDDLSHIDFRHMTRAIDSMLQPILWLVNSDFVPQWNPGGQP